MNPDGERGPAVLALAVSLLLAPAAHPLLRPAVGVASHLTWIVHVFAAAVLVYRFGRPGAVVLALSPAAILAGERLFGAGYGAAATWDTALGLAGSVGVANVLVAGLALRARRTRRQLTHLAGHDPLTGLPNRRRLEELLARCAQSAARSPDTFAVVYVDLNRFKRINDSFGHSVGDRVLRRVAERFVRSVGAEDVVGRIGGDEFLVLLRAVSTETQAAEQASALLDDLGSEPIRTEKHEVSVTASAGVAAWSDRYGDPEEVVRDADIALTEARERGYGEVARFREDMRREVQRDVRTENRLREALEGDQFELHYQPVFSARSRQLRGAEALLRWRRPERGLVPPGEFLPVIEASDLLYPLGQWVLEEAIRKLEGWEGASAGPWAPLVLSVNVSAYQFAHPPFVELARRVARRARSAGAVLELEITETALMSDAVGIDRAMERLREAGVRFAVDDFGTGYSSLRYLHALPVDTLKIDRGFVCGEPDSSCNEAILETIVSLADALDLETVAEGVETRGQLETTRRLGCTYVQGYLFSRPLPPASFRERYLEPEPAPRAGEG